MYAHNFRTTTPNYTILFYSVPYCQDKNYKKKKTILIPLAIKMYGVRGRLIFNKFSIVLGNFLLKSPSATVVTIYVSTCCFD